MLELAQIWLVDGTFKTAPSLFEQIYSVHGLRGGPTPLEDVISCLVSLHFCLINPKRHMRMWEVMKQLWPHAHPTHILMDFEMAAANAFSHFWPNTFVKGCFYHLTQNIFRKIQAEGFQHEYQNNDGFALQMKLIPALAFAPFCDVLD